MRCTREALVFAVAVAGAIAACTSSSDATSSGAASSSPIPERSCPPDSPLTYESFGEPFFSSWCTGCHSSQLTGDARRKAPAGFDYDSLASIRQWLPQIYQYAADSNSMMPPAGGPSAAERQNLGDWIACGAPGTDNGFHVSPSDSGTGHPPLPAAVLPRCSSQTHACLLACKEQSTCPGQCLSADTTPADFGINCAGCVFFQMLGCADPQCHESIAQYLCCLSSKCPTGDKGCLASQCGTENAAFALCLYYVTPDCYSLSQPLATACFASAHDGGSLDGGGGD